MENDALEMTPEQAARLLDDAQQTSDQIAARAAEPWWYWAAIGGGLGGLVAAQLVPEDLAWLRALLCLVIASGMVALVWPRLRNPEVRTRVWGGAGWLCAAGGAVAAVLVVLLWAVARPFGGATTLVTVVVAVLVFAVHTVAGLLSQRAYQRHVSRLR